MDIFDFPDDYVSQNPLTDQQMDQITNYLKDHPLFMNQLPTNIQQNQHLVALQALIDTQDPNTEAQSLCLQGNDILKKNPNNKHYLKNAYDKYTYGISLNPTKTQTLTKLHCNRALINLKLKNYGKVIIDCRICIKYDPNYIKAYYRCAQAYIAVKRFKEALELLQNRQQKQLDQLKKQAKKQLQKQLKKQQTKQQQKHKQLNEIQKYCKQKKYNLIKRNQTLPENAKIQIIENKLSIPVLFAYPQFGHIDIIARTIEEEKIKTYMNELLQNPLPWDQKQQYNLNSCELFFQLSQDKVMRIPKQAKIQQIAKRIPIRGALQISILAKSNKFYQSFLKNKQII